MSTKFIKSILDAATCPAGKHRLRLHDSKLPGLVLLVTAAGGKAFYLYRRINARPAEIRIGDYASIGIEQARQRAAELNLSILAGQDPRTARQAARDEMGFGQLFSDYMEKHAKPYKRTWKDDQGIYDLHLSNWAGRRLSSITRADVGALHAKIGENNGHYAANRVLALLCKAFNVGRQNGVVSDNPASGLVKFREHTRERFITPDEMPKFFTALNAVKDSTLRDFFWLSLLTGARRGNVQSMRWLDIDLSRAVWTIPHSQSKSGRAITVPLHADAVTILRRRHKASSASEYVFASERSATGHLVEPKKAWAKVLTAAGISDLRLHDVRRTVGSWMAAAGVSLPIIGATLGHTQAQTTQVYARLATDPVRDAIDTAVAAMQKVGKAKRA